jgi:hypothetical protein
MLVVATNFAGSAVTVALLVVMAVLWCLAVVSGIAFARHYQAWRRDLDASGKLSFRPIALRPTEVRQQLEPLQRVLRSRTGDVLGSRETAMRRRFFVLANSLVAFIAVALVACTIRWLM